MRRESEAVAELRRALGARLAACRGAKHLRQSDVAQVTSVDRSTVAHVERGQARASEQFWQLADDMLGAGGALVGGYRELEAARHAHQVQLQEQRLAALKVRDGAPPGEVATTRVSRQVGNLPAEVTSFVGRQDEIARIKELLPTVRLVTLTGVGGVGKSRLALRVATQVSRAFVDGAWLVELAPLRDPALVPLTLLETLGVHENSARGPVALLADYLRDRRVLLVLDNCEHLLDACAELVAALLAAAPDLQVLATSREPLDIPGEHRWPVPPMAAPDPDLPGPPDQHAAMTLYAHRAAAVLPGFVVTAQNRHAVARLCHRLDGIPLAIELAAARLPMLSVEQTVERLNDRFRLLTHQQRGVLPRHQTLHAAVRWSFELCEPAEQKLWARLSVFAGGFDLAAVETVCTDDDIAPLDVLNLMSGLVNKSVLICEQSPGRTRYRLLDTIRQFGQQMLQEAGEEDVLRRRHRDHYQQVVRQARAGFFTPRELESISRVRQDQGNLRVALDHCLSTPGEERAGLAMAAGLANFWMAVGGLFEPRRWLRRALELNPEPTLDRAKALGKCGHIALRLGEEEAAPLLEECRALAEQLGHSRTLAYATHWAGVAAWYRGDIPGGFALLQQALDRCRATEDVPGTQKALAWMAWAATAVDDPRALSFAEESLLLAETHDALWAKSWSLAMVALARWRRGETRHAVALLRDAIRIKRRFGDISGIIPCLDALAWTVCSDGRHEQAAKLLGATQAAWHVNGMTTAEIGPHLASHAECESQARQALGDAAFEAAWALGAALSIDETIAFALGERGPACAEKVTAPSPLTERERQVAHLVAEGLSNKDIAIRLMISTRTVESHVERILTKLNFSSRTRIAAWAAHQQTA